MLKLDDSGWKKPGGKAVADQQQVCDIVKAMEKDLRYVGFSKQDREIYAELSLLPDMGIPCGCQVICLCGNLSMSTPDCYDTMSDRVALKWVNLVNSVG